MLSKKIAVDAMGGDFAPEVVVQGAVLAARDYHIPVLLVGDEERIQKELEKNDGVHLPIEVHHAPEVIEMGEEPYHMIRKKKRSSLRRAFELVKQNEAHGLVSAGNSGAVVYGALFVLKRIKHISRPGIATAMPSVLGTVLVIDAGANTICKPRNLVQFALMGSVFCTHMFNMREPRIGVLSNGEEETKGTDLTRITNELLKKSPLNYIGYVEGREVFSGNVDVVVCDGFVGNVLLKVSEGIVESIVGGLKKEFEKRFLSKIGYLFAQKSFLNLKKQLDYAEYGGAPLLGVEKPVIICHGSSNARALMNAIRVANEYVQKDITGKFLEELQHHEYAQGIKKTQSLINKLLHSGSRKENEEPEAPDE
jgi:glycerol-3-phosphate acyltransferase PlsX